MFQKEKSQKLNIAYRYKVWLCEVYVWGRPLFANSVIIIPPKSKISKNLCVYVREGQGKMSKHTSNHIQVTLPAVYQTPVCMQPQLQLS